MVGSQKNGPIEQAKCVRYGLFLQHTTIHQSNAIFWSLFILDITLLITVSIAYSSQSHRQAEYRQSLSADHDELEEAGVGVQYYKKRADVATRRCFYVSLTCTLMSLFSCIIEAIAGLSITFCHKEDLTMFYWGFFFLLSIGSLIATVGILFMCVIHDQDRARNPPWKAEMGTPVLVISGLGHFLFHWVKAPIMRRLGIKEPIPLPTPALDRGQKIAVSRDSFLQVMQTPSVNGPAGTPPPEIWIGVPPTDRQVGTLIGRTHNGVPVYEYKAVATSTAWETLPESPAE